MANAVPSRLVDSVNGLIGKVKLLILKTVTFNIITPSLLEFKDQDGGLLDNVNIGIPNVENLQSSLDDKVDDNQVLTNVPLNALFTDTVYNDTVIQSEVTLNSNERHNHTNKPVIDKFGEDVNGAPTYNGVKVDTTIAQRDVYDGLDSTDNTISLSANNGKFLRDIQITQQTAINLNTAKETNINHPLVEKAVPANALFTDTVYDENISVRRVLISTSALPANFTSTDVKNWLNANESIGDSEILFWETTADTVVVTLAVNILTPTEGQSITGDVNITFELFNNTGVNILTPTEGQEITGDVNITFEIL